ncbi:MAG: phage head closure protein [Oenococcus sp.]|uniref:phage head closure protein n=1 Tax=Oenococcus sp. TaxID=1979414 RepID=UPI0039EB2941
MANNFALLNRRGQFGSVKTTTNPHTGSSSEVLNQSFSRWYGVRTRTVSQTYQIFGTDLQDTIDIVIRHDPAIRPPMIFQDSQGVQYDIVSVAPDDTGSLNAFDILTLKMKSMRGTMKNG